MIRKGISARDGDHMRVISSLVLMLAGLQAVAQDADPLSQIRMEAAAQRGMIMAERAVDALVRMQADDGSWGQIEGRPALPALTGLALTGLLLDPEIDASHPAVRKGIDSILSYQQPDGGIYDRILPSYNTAICVSALALAQEQIPEARAAVQRAVPFLKGLQWSEFATLDEAVGDSVARVTRQHPFYGGVGYGQNGRPDNSNLNLWLQALHDAGVPADDPAVERALVFLSRTQMLDAVNDMDYADGSQQGGFIYATSPTGDEIGVGESKAGALEETLSDGTVQSRLRAYGSMTYAGFKSFAYAELSADDPRVIAARDWIATHYTLQENPGVGLDGLYYFYMTVGRALSAWGEPTIDVRDPRGTFRRHWGVDLIDALAPLQEPDGSFRSVDDRWMESSPELITAYALIGLQSARSSVE